jgi:hypothetical protein
MAVDGGVLGQLRADVHELGFLLEARDGHTTLPPPGDALFEGCVVELAAQQQDAL